MQRCFGLPVRIHMPLRLMPSARLFLLVVCTSFAASVVWMQLISSSEQSPVVEGLIEEALENVGKDVRYSEVYRKKSKLPKNLKYILLWTQKEFAPLYYFKEGQRAFINNNCSVINCYVTSNRKFFNGDVTKFNAIAFNGRNMRKNDLPKRRSPHQKYIYMNMESAENYPVCHKKFDSFFNWTATYRLDSDIPFPYILIRDSQGRIIGPKRDLKWSNDLPEVNNSLADRLKNKTRAAAWFVSHCSSKSDRKTLVKNLQKALYSYGYHVDVYGACGPLKCPRNKTDQCGSLLEKDYFFYLSLENSFSEDYVTEKVLTALQHNTVPIVYGSADYSRFLPPGSYLDARKFNVYELAAIMDRLISTPNIYRQYFRWQNEYTFSEPATRENVCEVCAALNNKWMMEKVTVYENFRKWWFPDYDKRCLEPVK